MGWNKIMISLSKHQVLENALYLKFFHVFSILENIIENLLEEYTKQTLHFLYFREAVGDALTVQQGLDRISQPV